MRLFKPYEMNGVKGYQLGWSLAGPPLMSVFCYTFGNVMIDTGQSHMQKEALQVAQSEKIEKIYLTHHHEDHSGNAAAIKKAVSAKVYGHEWTARKMENAIYILPYQKYIWGKTSPLKIENIPDIIETGLGQMIPVYTPGHAKDHMVYYLKEQGIVFSGDLYLGDKIKFFRSDENLKMQIESLKTVKDLDFDTLLCNHRPRSEKGQVHIQRKLSFLEDLYGSIKVLWEKGLTEKQIFKILKLKENYFIKAFCFGNVSMVNGVRSVVQSLNQGF